MMPRRTLSHYEILDKIGKGGMGALYRAVDTRLDRPVALKLLPPPLIADLERRGATVFGVRVALLRGGCGESGQTPHGLEDLS